VFFKNKKILLIIIAAVVIIAGGVTYFIVGGKKTISMKDAVEISTTSGYSGYATVKVRFKEGKQGEYLRELTGAVSDDELRAKPEFREKGMVIDGAIKIHEDEFENLSNGDKIKVVIDVDQSVADKYKFKVTDVENELEVSGLTEIPKSLDDLGDFKNKVYEDGKKQIEEDLKKHIDDGTYFREAKSVLDESKKKAYEEAYGDKIIVTSVNEETRKTAKYDIKNVKEVFFSNEDDLKSSLGSGTTFNCYYCIFKVSLSDSVLTTPIEYYVYVFNNGLTFKKDSKEIDIKDTDSICKSSELFGFNEYKSPDDILEKIKQEYRDQKDLELVDCK